MNTFPFKYQLGKALFFLASCSAILGLSNTKAEAALIGDEVNVQLISQNATLFDEMVTVTANDSEVTFFDQTINIESETIEINFNANAVIPNIENFWKISNLDWVDFDTGRITGVNVTSNIPGYQESTFPFPRVSFFEDMISIDIANIEYNNQSFIRVDLEVEHENIPESSSVPGLLILGTLGFVLVMSRQLKFYL